MREKVEKQSQAPTNCHAFLRMDKTKTELFQFLSEWIMQIENRKIVV